MQRRYSKTELGMSYGIVAGGMAGVVLLSLTGNAVWLALLGGLGLVAGLIVGQLLDDRPRG